MAGGINMFNFTMSWLSGAACGIFMCYEPMADVTQLSRSITDATYEASHPYNHL